MLSDRQQIIELLFATFEEVQEDAMALALRFSLNALQDFGVEDVVLDGLQQTFADDGQGIARGRVSLPRNVAQLAHGAQRARAQLLAHAGVSRCHQ